MLQWSLNFFRAVCCWSPLVAHFVGNMPCQQTDFKEDKGIHYHEGEEKEANSQQICHKAQKNVLCFLLPSETLLDLFNQISGIYKCKTHENLQFMDDQFYRLGISNYRK